jgi:nucleoside 2-deoxyribosyltransferase
LKIYIASSWKNNVEAINLADILRADGHEVDCFCDTSTGRYVFHFSEVGPLDEIDAIGFLQDSRAQRAYREDKKHIDWADAVVMLHPCGKSSHLEAGYAVGAGKKLFMLGEFPKGEFDVMYGFADSLHRNIEELCTTLSMAV